MSLEMDEYCPLHLKGLKIIWLKNLLFLFLRKSKLYLYKAEHPLMEGSGRVVFGQNCLHQNSFNELLRCHQDVKAMTTVLHTGLQNLRNGEAIHNMKNKCDSVFGVCTRSPVLTVRANITSLKFLFPTILLRIALTESLGLGKKATHQCDY